MDNIKSGALFTVFLITILIVNGHADETANKENCRTCKPGYFVTRMCNSNSNTICSPCPYGSFTLDDNLDKECKICSVCPHGFYKTSNCTKVSDTLCLQCSAKDLIHRKQCLESQSAVLAGDKLHILDGTESQGISISDEGSGDETEDLNIDITDFLVPTRDPNSSVISADEEGSGEEVDLVIKNEDSMNTSLTEGMLSSISSPESSTNDTNFSDEVISEELIPMVSEQMHSTKLPTTASTTTISASTESEPTSSDKTTSRSFFPFKTPEPEPETSSQHVPITSLSPDTTTTSEDGIIGIVDSDGIILEPGNKDTSTLVYNVPENIDVHIPNKPDKRKGNVHRSVLDPTPTSPQAEPKVGSQETKMTDDRNMVTIGVVVAVAIVAAIVFFVLGFLVSRYCRKRRQSFKVMKKVETDGTNRNGGLPVPVSLEFHEPERDTTIYDDIDKPNGKPYKPTMTTFVPVPEDEVVPAVVNDVYAVPDKKRKSEGSPKIEEQLDRIKFIDETTDDEFGVKDDLKINLLANGNLSHESLKINSHNNVSNSSIPQSPEASRETDNHIQPEPEPEPILESSIDKVEPEEELDIDESSPMLYNGDVSDSDMNVTDDAKTGLADSVPSIE